MNAEQLMHGQDWQGQDLAGWFITEKLDGCRALWTGTEFVTRTGHPIAAPAWFTVGLPAIPLDGEIFAGRGEFEAARLAVQCGQFAPGLAFVAFDAPEADGYHPQRLAVAEFALRDAPHGRAVDGYTAASTAEVLDDLDVIHSLGGEGVMASRPNSIYAHGRTSNLRKIKARRTPARKWTPPDWPRELDGANHSSRAACA